MSDQSETNLQNFNDESLQKIQQSQHMNNHHQSKMRNVLFDFQELENVQRNKQQSRNQIKHISLLKPRSVSNQDYTRPKNAFSRDSINSIDTYVSNTTLNSNSLANHNKNLDIFHLLKETDSSFQKNSRLHSNSNRVPFNNESQVRLNKLPSILKDTSNQLSQNNCVFKQSQNTQNVQLKQYILDYQVMPTNNQQYNENKYNSSFLRNKCFKNYSYSRQYQQCKQKQYYLKAVEKSTFLQPNLNMTNAENENRAPDQDLSVSSINNITLNESNKSQKKVNFISYNSYIKI
ncbi:hypothetical protein ABPG72_004017 [Tetrahymena utriculariae]